MKMVQLIVGALLTACASVCAPAFAQSDPPVVVGFTADSPQSCSYDLFGKTGLCSGILYMHFQNNHRTTFTFAAGDSSFTFSGDSSIQPTIDLYLLTIDHIAVIDGLHKPPTPVDHRATGQCRANASKDGQRMDQLLCGATTEFGNLTLAFSGHRAVK